MDEGASADLARLTRWTDAGGTWRLLERGRSRVTVALLTCDGGQEMDRIVSEEPALVELVTSPGAEADSADPGHFN
jgi:hypothetical protein